LTWRLAGSPPAPPAEVFSRENADFNAVHSLEEQLDDRAASGPFWLQETRVANMLAKALRYGEAVRQSYWLYAWVIMPNHVHVILRPRIELPSLMRWLKGRTGHMANRMLGRTGTPFWQDESFDHWIRSDEELHNLIKYVEENPVKAGLVELPKQWPWSSAGFIAADDTNRSSALPPPVSNFFT
jgi:REP element-mobilizing transposase RayT